MRRADAPPPGWYPDPIRRDQLRWWDGLDWTDRRRAPAIKADWVQEAMETTEDGAPQATGASRTSAGRASSMTRQEATEVIAEARRAAREEADRAIEKLSGRARDATRRLEPLIGEYGDRAMKWIRNLFIVIVALVVLWMVLQTVGQASLIDWIGDRVDNIVGAGGRAPSRA